MNTRICSALVSVVVSCAGAGKAATLAPIHTTCKIGFGEEPGKFGLHVDNGDCPEDHHCGTSFSNELTNRFTGISLADLSHEGAHLAAALASEAGTFTCTGVVHAQVLTGDAVFTPDAAFVERMGKMGFTGFDSQKLEAYAFVNVESAFAQSLQQADIRGMNIDNLIALRIFNVDPAYMQSIVALGYEKPDADQLIALKVQGVNAEEVREMRGLGFKPTIDELIQIRIFKITPDFVHRMQDRGFKDLTIAKLVQIRIFKLAE
jgi:hypothetical protein